MADLICGKEPQEFVDNLFNLDLNPSRRMLERIWFRNTLYYMGEQWIEFFTSTQSFRRKAVKPFTPTPVSNIIRDTVRAMKALMINKAFTIRIFPNSNSLADKEAADLAEKVIRDMDVANDSEFKEEVEKVVEWMIIYGTSFARTFPMMDRGEFGYDKKGNLIKSGDVYSEAILPFSVFLDDLGDNLRSKRYVGLKTIKPREWVEDTFKVKLNKEDTFDDMNYQRQLMKIVADVSPWKGYGVSANMFNYETEDVVVLKEIEFKPTPKYKDGRYVISAGSQILLDVNRMPIPVENNDWYYTFTDFHYYRVPGRYWSDGGVNDLISPQNAINQIDQAMEMNRKSLGRPVIYWPHGTSIKRKTNSGQSFIGLEYDARQSGGQKPEIKHGTPLPNQFLEERNIHRGVAQEAAGDPKNILRGSNPSGTYSGYHVDILRETAEQSHEPDIQRYFRSLQRVYRKRLVLAKKIYSEKRLLKINEGDVLEVRHFTGADFRNNTDVRLEPASDVATTKAGKTQVISQLASNGFFGDLQMQPELRSELLNRIGLGGIKDSSNVHVERAQREHDKLKSDSIDQIFLAMTDPETGEDVVVNQDPDFAFDEHGIHYEIHRNFILSNEFQMLDEKAQVVMRAHTELHERATIEKQMQQQQVAQMMQPQPPQEGGSGEIPIPGMEEPVAPPEE